MTQTVDLRRYEDELVIHFGGTLNQVSADTFAKSLIEITKALKEINRIVNPDFEIEVYVDALGAGSFRTRISTAQKKVSTLLHGTAKPLVISLFAAFIYDKVFSTQPEINIIPNDDHYIVEQGDKQIILPKDAQKYQKRIKESPEVEKRMSKTFEILQSDRNVTEFGVTENIDDERPSTLIQRDEFPKLAIARDVTITEETHRTKDEKANLLIIRAIFERGNRKWQFVWGDGIKISAPILHDEFYDKLRSHEYVIGTGDTLQVILRIHQVRDEMSNVWVNEHYEVIEVHGHTAAIPPPSRMFD